MRLSKAQLRMLAEPSQRDADNLLYEARLAWLDDKNARAAHLRKVASLIERKLIKEGKC